MGDPTLKCELISPFVSGFLPLSIHLTLVVRTWLMQTVHEPPVQQKANFLVASQALCFACVEAVVARPKVKSKRKFKKTQQSPELISKHHKNF